VIGSAELGNLFFRIAFPVAPAYLTGIHTPNIPDDLKEAFLKSYETYVTATEQGRRQDAWLAAVDCRKQLQKIGDITSEERTCQEIFQDFMTKEQAAEIYQRIHKLTLTPPGT
jgi:hypothetical protein